MRSVQPVLVWDICWRMRGMGKERILRIQRTMEVMPDLQWELL
jgi:hypothetical protein